MKKPIQSGGGKLISQEGTIRTINANGQRLCSVSSPKDPGTGIATHGSTGTHDGSTAARQHVASASSVGHADKQILKLQMTGLAMKEPGGEVETSANLKDAPAATDENVVSGLEQTVGLQRGNCESPNHSDDCKSPDLTDTSAFAGGAVGAYVYVRKNEHECGSAASGLTGGLFGGVWEAEIRMLKIKQDSDYVCETQTSAWKGAAREGDFTAGDPPPCQGEGEAGMGEGEGEGEGEDEAMKICMRRWTWGARAGGTWGGHDRPYGFMYVMSSSESTCWRHSSALFNTLWGAAAAATVTVNNAAGGSMEREYKTMFDAALRPASSPWQKVCIEPPNYRRVIT